MLILVERRKLFGAFVATGLIIASIIMSKGGQEYSSSQDAESPKSQAAVALFVIGWVLFAYLAALGADGLKLKMNIYTLWMVGSVILIIIAMSIMQGSYVTGMTKQGMDAMLTIGLVSLAGALSWGKSWETMVTALLGSGALIASHFVLPEQEKMGMVYGPGMALLPIGFSLLYFAVARPY